MDAVSWHSSIARKFERKYAVSNDFSERLAVWSELVVRHAKPTGAVLDAGCGAGNLSSVAAKHAQSLFAFDASPEMLEIARERMAREGHAHAVVTHARMCDAGLLDGKRFDLILCSSVLEYLPDYWAALEWLASALAPDGVILFSMPNGSSLYRKLERACFNLTGRPRYLSFVRHWPTSEIVTRGLAERGFAVADLRYYGVALMPMGGAGTKGPASSLFVVAARRAGAATA